MKSKLMIVLMASISLIGCTSMRELDAQHPDFAEQIEVGDHLVVHEKTGRVVDMTLTEIDGGVLYGSYHGQGLQSVDVYIDDIAMIEIEKISVAKTSAAVVGGIVLLPIAALGLGLAAASY